MLKPKTVDLYHFVVCLNADQTVHLPLPCGEYPVHLRAASDAFHVDRWDTSVRGVAEIGNLASGD